MQVTINSAQQPNDDFFKTGTLVQSDDCGRWIVLVSEEEEPYKGYFCSMIIYSSEKPKRIGEYCTAWEKKDFVKFVGNIILEQE